MHEVIRIDGDGVRSIRDMAPKGRVMCRYQEKWLLRAGWDRVPTFGEPVEFVEVAGNKEEFRTILTVAAVAAAAVSGGASLAGIPGAAGYSSIASYFAAASLAYNLIVPPSGPEQPPPPKDIFAASISGNQARLDDPIWRTLGIDRISPPFAGMPYTRFVDDDGDNVDNEQYLYAVLAGGYGPVDILAEFLGTTPLGHYKDILVRRVLQPGEQPTIAKANVFTSQDIGGFELNPRTSVGSYVACPPGKTVSQIEVDIIAPNGLGAVDSDGATVDVTAKWIVQARRINDAGAPLSSFRTVPGGIEERTLQTNTQQRWTGTYEISPPGRVEVRVYRTNNAVTSPQARDTIQWVGLRGFSSEPAPLNPNTWHYELVMRSSKQVSQVNQSDINLFVQGKTRTWSPGGGWSCAIGDWANYTANRSPAWGLADLWSDPNWGEGLPDERIDLQGLYDFAQTNAARQDRCDYTFSSTTDAWSASQLIARTGRARVFRRYGVRTLRRDELAELGETAFTARMCRAGTSMTMVEKRPQYTDPDGIIAEYRSNVTWDRATVECPCPGIVSMERPVYKSYPGIQGRTHALREGLYDAADMALRQRTVQFETEMQAVCTSFMAPVRWMPQIYGYGQTGDVVDWNAATLVMSLSEPADFSRAPIYLTLRRDDGSITEPVLVTAGPTANDIRLTSAPDFTLVLNDGKRERPVFLLGPAMSDEIVKVASISDAGASDGAPFFSVTAVVDDPLVHTVDNAYLPGPGDDQDPIGLPGDDAAEPGQDIVVLEGGSYVWGQPLLGGAVAWELYLNTDGSASIVDTSVPVTYPLDRQWVASPIEPATAALYEVIFSVANPFYNDAITGSAINTWLNLGTARSWHLDASINASVDRQDVVIDVQIRLADDGSLQTSARYIVNLRINNLS